MFYVPYSWSSPWGEGIKSIGIKLKIQDDSGNILAQTPVLDHYGGPIPDLLESSTRELSLRYPGFIDEISLQTIRITKKRDGYTDAAKGYTSEYRLTFSCRPDFRNKSLSENSELFLKCEMTPHLTKNFRRDVVNTLALNFEVLMDTIN